MRLTKLLPIVALLAASRAPAQEAVRAPAGPGLRVTPERFLSPHPTPTPTPAPYLVLDLGLSFDPNAGTRAVAGLPPAVGLAPGPGVDPDLRLDLDRDLDPLALARARWGPGASGAFGRGAVARGDTVQERGLFRELELPDVVRENAELSLQVEGRGELGGAWNRYRPCEPGLRLNCNPDLFPQLRPDVEFGVKVGGTISDRIHVDVDYDQRREFDAANSISVYYQGFEGEAVQRVEMGDVSIGLPSSRYLTQGIPAGNFGFKAAGRLGATEVEAVWAQQKGDVAAREFRLGGGGRAGLVQDQERVIDDAEYVRGQFFFLVAPSQIAGHPHLDVLALVAQDAPLDVRPSGDRLVVYRDEGASTSRYQEQAQAGKFLADAVTDGGTLRHSGLFTLLEPGVDYTVHSSGLWIALRAPLRDDEALAVAYVTESGDTVGDAAPEMAPPGQKPELRLIRGPVTIHQPGQPTWDYEMHQVYRLDSSTEVEQASLELVVSLGHVAGGATFKEEGGKRIPLLRLLGLDDDAPVDRVDAAHIFRPGGELDGLGGTALRGTFVVFPTLRPFGAPPPVPSEGLTAAEAAVVLGTDANPDIYDVVDPVVRTSSSRFRLNFRYRVRLDGVPSSFNLGAFGIRQGSERISVDGKLLRRNLDYVVDYDLGVVTLLDPQAVLGGDPDAEIRATWEQKSLFDIAPTTVFGLNSRTRLGPYGELNLVGLYQSEQSVVRRPQLGTAPGAVLLGGASGRLAFQGDWAARALDAIPLLAVDSIARLDLTGELALSAPNPNRRGDTYLDDFEATDEIPLSLDATEWKLGSAPQDATAVPQLPWPLSPGNAAPMVWQDRYLSGDGEVGFLTPQDIDQQIAVAGARLAERVLYLTLDRPRSSAPAPTWRSITTALSTTGRDLSRSEFLEFYAAPWTGAVSGAVLVVDIGSVSEDAYYFDETGSLEGVHGLGRAWGRGVLDEEARLALREVWGPSHDRLGLWDQECEADRLNPVPLGDPRANCTVLNGRPDTEDLNANGVLDDLDGPMFRYVIPLDLSSPYLVRDRGETQTNFRLFRIPLRGSAGTALNGATEASWRFVKHIRMTVVKPEAGKGTLALARLRIAGSRWTKRGVDGVMRGLVEEIPGAGAATTEFRVGPVSQLTDGPVYSSPPGVSDELQDPKAAIGPTGAEFNEKSLRLSWTGLLGQERAEVFFRYPQQPRSFLEYRELRFWAVGRRGDWGPGGDHRLLVKLGTDARNYYLYQTRLHPPAGSDRVRPEDWRPEHIIDFDTWFALKAEAERLLVERGPGGPPLAVWTQDSTYAVVLEDRARAPNLASVRELSFAVYNGGLGETNGEVWIDDLRLSAGARDMGFAGRVDVNVDAGGFLAASASFGGRGGHFRQLDDFATYQSSDDLVLNGSAELGRFAPREWGVSMPLSVSYVRSRFDPVFLQGTDVRADRLAKLRDTESTRRRVGISLRKTTPTSNPILGALVDGTSVRLGYVTAADGTVTSASRLSGVDGGLEYDQAVAPVELDVVPGFVEAGLRWLMPRRVEESEFFRRLTGAHLRLTPRRIGFSTAYTSQQARVWRYDRILAGAGDAHVDPIESPRRTLESSARVSLQPFESLTGGVSLLTGRDLLEPERATTLALEQQALREARTQWGGVPLGWERDRMMATDLAYRPIVATWLRPSVAWTTRFGQRRDPSYLDVRETPDGPLARLQRTFHADRRLSRSVILDPALMTRSALADGREDGAGLLGRAALAVTRPVKPVELTWTDEVGSRFDRRALEPGWGYQLGWGGLDGMRVVGGDTAVTALRRDGFRARSGVRLGAGAALDLGFSESQALMLDLSAGRREQEEHSWPDVQLSWHEMPVPAGVAGLVERWSFSTGYVHTRRLTTLLAGTGRVRSENDGTVPLELRLGLVGGLSIAYLGTLTAGDGRDPTGRTEQSALTHGVDLGGRFMAPRALRDRFPDPLRLNLSYDYQAQSHCRKPGNRGPTATCTPFIDFMNRRMNLTLSTLVSRMDLGLQASYIDRRSFIGTQAGSSQFQLGLFGQFNLQAATLEP